MVSTYVIVIHIVLFVIILIITTYSISVVATDFGSSPDDNGVDGMDGVPDDDNDNGDEVPFDAASQVRTSVAGLVGGNVGKNYKPKRRREEAATTTDPRRSKRVPVPKKTD